MVDKKQIKEYLDSEIGQDIQVLTAFTIKATPTKKDDEFVEKADDAAEMINQLLKNVNELAPTEKEAKQAAVRVLERVAKLTKTKWDDRIIAILKPFIG